MEQGLLYCFMVLGVYITFRVLDFPDLTVDGSLPLGATVTAAMATGGHSVYLATAAGMGAGLVAGLFTGLLHLLLKMGQADATNYGPKLLSGILMMTALYTVNLRVMGRSNIPLLSIDTMFDRMGQAISVTMTGWRLVAALLVFMLIIKFILDWFLHTEMGLALSNGLVALTGSIVAQQQGFADIGMGIGTIVAGLAGVVIGEVVFGMRSIGWVLFSAVGGSITYRLLIALSLRMWIEPTDVKLLTALLVVVALASPAVRKKVVNA